MQQYNKPSGAREGNINGTGCNKKGNIMNRPPNLNQGLPRAILYDADRRAGMSMLEIAAKHGVNKNIVTGCLSIYKDRLPVDKVRERLFK